MDIEAIRKRAKADENFIIDSTRICEAFNDRDRLLAYVDNLESRLRWKKVAEEKPPIETDFLIRGFREGDPVITLLQRINDPEELIEHLNRKYRSAGIIFTEWREIE